MKRITALFLAIAMLLSLLCITASAAELTYINMDFEASVGQTIHADSSVITAESNLGDEAANCLLMLKTAGSEAADQIALQNAASVKALNTVCADYLLPADHTVYAQQEYLFVFALIIPEGTTAADDVSLSIDSGEAVFLFSDDACAYFYLLFTPAAASNDSSDTTDGSDDSNTDSGTSGDDIILGSGGNSDTLTGISSSGPIDVTAVYDDSNVENTVYSVVITWGSMAFTYHPSFVGEWDPSTHSYSNSQQESWSWESGANAIVVTNHSNASVNAGFSFAPADGYSISGAFFNSDDSAITASVPLASAVGTTYEEAPFFNAYLKLSGSLAKAASSVKCGTVTVTIS